MFGFLPADSLQHRKFPYSLSSTRKPIECSAAASLAWATRVVPAHSQYSRQRNGWGNHSHLLALGREPKWKQKLGSGAQAQKDN